MLFRRQRVPSVPKNAFGVIPGSSLVPAFAELVGDLDGVRDLSIAGRLVGDVRALGELVVTASGVVEGAVEARAVRIAGRVTGPVLGEERVEVAAGGVVEGDISSAHVVLADGAVLRGQVDVIRSPA
jgi:cytoskeletal protein CcmA (bactofilin family)